MLLDRKIEWKVDETPIEYNNALKYMETYVKEMQKDASHPNVVWLTEHYDVYTKGISAKENELLINTYNIPVVETNRGGKYTYHGKGQRVIYPILDLSATKDISEYIRFLESWIINTLANFGIKAYTKKGSVGVWVKKGNSDSKLAAIGVKLKKWIAYHGISVNIFTSLDKFCGIIPCGIDAFQVTSLEDLGINISYESFDAALIETFNNLI